MIEGRALGYLHRVGYLHRKGRECAGYSVGQHVGHTNKQSEPAGRDAPAAPATVWAANQYETIHRARYLEPRIRSRERLGYDCHGGTGDRWVRGRCAAAGSLPGQGMSLTQEIGG